MCLQTRKLITYLEKKKFRAVPKTTLFELQRDNDKDLIIPLLAPSDDFDHTPLARGITLVPAGVEFVKFL